MGHMSEPATDPEDPLIRTILLSSAAAAVLGLIATVLVVAAMISANWNFMDWLE
jgi:uncharacterized protein involved in exopolysaccharide biosynthesis